MKEHDPNRHTGQIIGMTEGSPDGQNLKGGGMQNLYKIVVDHQWKIPPCAIILAPLILALRERERARLDRGELRLARLQRIGFT